MLWSWEKWIKRIVPGAKKISKKQPRSKRSLAIERFPLSFESLEDRVVPSTFIVTNTQDSGAGSLRAGIQSGDSVIDFNIPTSDSGYNAATGVFTITLQSSLPAINSAVDIDGTSQPGYATAGHPVINVNGNNVVNGLIISGNNTTIKGLAVNDFQLNGIEITGNDNVIQDNYIGTDATGVTAKPNGNDGVLVENGATGNTIGGTVASEGNLISGNTNAGVGIFDSNTTGNLVEYNFIGINASNTASIPNGIDILYSNGATTNPVLNNTQLSSGSWTEFQTNVGDSFGTMDLLPNGDIMISGSNDEVTNNWFELTPDAQGSYLDGTLTSLANSKLERLYTGAVVLPNDDLMIYGGEYSGASGGQTFVNSGEIYNPATNTWTTIASIPGSLDGNDQFGDDPLEVLPNGTVIGGYLLGPQTFIYNPTTNTWSAGPQKLYGDQTDEEAWAKLPGTDGNILDYAIFGSNFSAPGVAQYLDTATNTWVATGPVPVALSESDLAELGPALLMPSTGDVFQIGANGASGGSTNTANYNPITNTWSAGPIIPGDYTADDAAGAVLPDSNVIFDADQGIQGGDEGFSPPTAMFEYNGSTITQIPVPSDLNNDFSGEGSYVTRMLVLPTGQIALADSSGSIWLYQESASPNPSWAPTISTVVSNGGGTYTLTGTQLNGMDEGADYGDDAGMASNYPIVQFTNAAGNVFDGETFNWSSEGVATGSTPVSTEFTLPANLPVGEYSMSVNANGISSSPIDGFYNGTVLTFTPTITGVNPSAGPVAGGSTVTITGFGLGSTTAVDFGSTRAMIVSESSTQVVATSPAGSLGTVDVTVTSPLGTSLTSPADLYTYLAVPNVTGISPSAGPLGGGTVVTISGTALDHVTQVDFGGNAATIDSDSATSLVVTEPAGSAGIVDVVVTTEGGTSATSTADQFTYVPPPSITSFGPSAGPLVGGTTVTIDGANLANVTSVDFGSQSVMIDEDTATQLVVTSPAGSVGSVTVTVTTAGGTVTRQFTYVPVPVVSRIGPVFGPAAGGTTVTITGINLANATEVDFGGTAGAVVSDAANQIVVTSPAENAGVVDVTVITAGGTSATLPADQFTYFPAPVITGISPAVGPLGGGTTVTISGTNLANATAVDFGIYGVTIKSDTATQIIVTDPSSGAAGPVNVTVTNPGGTGTGTFDYLAAPVITSVGPPYGSEDGGTTVIISGTSLAFATSVDFGSHAATIDSDTPTTLIVTSPAGSLGLTTMTVTTPGGTTTEQYTYYPPPEVTGVSPAFGPVAGGTTVTITGTNLTDGQVEFGTVAGIIDHLSATQIVATSPAESSGFVDVTVTTDGGTSPITSADQFYFEPPVDPATSFISLGDSTVQSGSGITVTLQTEDSNGNDILKGGQQVVFGLENSKGGRGTFSSVTDNGNGTYSATFTGSVAGINNITASIDNQPVTSGSPSITVTPGQVSLTTSIATVPIPPKAQSGSGLTITLQTEDASGNDNPVGIQTVAFELGSNTGGQGTFSTVTSLGNGEYTATFTGTIAGTNTIVAVINGQPITSGSPSITVTPGSFSLSNSVVTLPPPASVPSGSGITVTLQTEDANGNDNPAGIQTVAFELVGNTGGEGTFGTVADLGNGEYTATFTGTAAGNNTIDALINGQTVTSGSPSIAVTPGQVTLSTSVVTLPPPASVQSGSGITVTLQTEDVNGNDNPTGIQTVAFKLAGNTGGGGTFSSVANLGNGEYTATFTGTIAGSNSITALINGQTVTSSLPSITITPASFSLSTSVVTLPPPASVQSGSGITVTLQAEDANGNDNPTGVQTVAFALGSNTGGAGTFSSVANLGNGEYTATFTGAIAGGNTITATINGQTVASTAPITITPGPASVTKSVVNLSLASIPGGGQSTVTLLAKDADGNDLTSGHTVVFSLVNPSGGQGTFNSVTYIGNGTYRANFTGTTIGSNTIAATIDGNTVTSGSPSITVTLGAVSLAQSTVVLGTSSIEAGGATSVTLYARDGGGNLETTSTPSVAFSLGSTTGAAGQFSAITNNHNGTYTATFKGTLAGASTIVATINGSKLTSTAPTITVTHAVYSLSFSTVTAMQPTVQSGSSGTTITLQAVSISGVNEISGGLTVAYSLGSTTGGKGTFGPVTDLGNGTYTATFKGTIAGKNTIVATIDGSKVTSTAPTISVTPGSRSLTTSIVTVSAASVKAGSSVTVTLQAKDADGNKLTTGGLTDVVFALGNGSDVGTLTAATDNNNGTYTATFTGTTVGSNTIVTTIGGSPVATAPPAIAVTHGPFSVANSIVTATPGSIESGGKTTIVLQPEDAYGNHIANSALIVAFSLGTTTGAKGTFGPVKYNTNGTFSATFTGTIAGTNTIVTTINGQKVTSTPPSITVTPGALSLAKSIVIVSPSSVGIGGTIQVTLQAKDAAGNDLATGGSEVLFLLKNAGGGRGTFTATTDNNNGTYTATFKATAVGDNSILATIGGDDITSPLPSITLT